MIDRLLRAAICAALLGSGSTPAAEGNASGRPDFSGYWQIKFERSRSGQSLLEELPPGAVFIDDGGGGELGAGDFAGLQLSQAAVEEIRNYNYKDELKRESTCVAPSAVFYMQAPFPMQIHQVPGMLVFQMEYFDMVRIVFMDGRGHPPADAPHTKSGHSIGHWENDTLVIDTSHLAAGTLMNNGLTHSDNIHMLERFRLSPDGTTLWATQIYDDPDVFAGIGARYIAWTRADGQYIYPYDCDPSFGE